MLCQLLSRAPEEDNECVSRGRDAWTPNILYKEVRHKQADPSGDICIYSYIKLYG